MTTSLPWLVPLVAGVFLLLMVLLERRRPLRPTLESRARRIARNLATGGLATAISLPLQLVLLAPLVVALETHELGLMRLVSLPEGLSTLIAIALLDATLWHWHWLNHRVPLLWRFHLVHHSDRDMDASTGLRFHLGELALSILYRAAQLTLIGPSALAVAIWSAVLTVSVLFHHGNLRLPFRYERWLVHFVVTPRFHDLHHSIDPRNRDANYSSILSIWDRVWGTSRRIQAEAHTTIGVPGYLAPEDAVFKRLMVLPFEAPRAESPDGSPPPR